jgi:hypothetical protein
MRWDDIPHPAARFEENHMLGFRLSAALLLVTLVFSAPGVTVAADEAQIDQWIVLLRGENFQGRREAIAKLAQADVDAVQPVADLAAEGEAELVRSCVSILKQIQDRGSDKGKEAAKTALEELAKSDLPQVANAAATALKGGADELPVLPGIRGGRNVRIGIRQINGRRSITIKDPNREVTIEDENGKNIKMTVEEQVNGAPQKKEYQADDLDDLKKKDPGAAELYEKYTKQNPIQVQFRAFGGPIPPGFPIPAGLPGAPRGAAAPAANEKIETALKKLSAAQEKLEKLKSQDKVEPAQIDELLDELKAAEKELFSAQAALR